MYEVKKKYPDSGIYPFSNTLKKKFLNRLLPEQEEVIFPGDTILYMLCGLSLITLEESHQYIKQTQIARDLAKRLKSKLIMEKLKELYDKEKQKIKEKEQEKKLKEKKKKDRRYDR